MNLQDEMLELLWVDQNSRLSNFRLLTKKLNCCFTRRNGEEEAYSRAY